VASVNPRRRAKIAARAAPPVDRAAEGLGEQLKAWFDTVAAEPLPKEITALVEELERKQRRHPRGGGTH
jgi:hypothetical protein